MFPSSLHYDIIEKLGEGGMGVVYLAIDTKLNRKVALKFLPGYITDDSEIQQRFRNEARAAAALSHPNIAHIYAIEECKDGLFIVMEYVKGLELKECIKNNSLSASKKENIALHIAKGMQAAHKKKIIHRDIKSSNMMLDEEGTIKIMDFGLARIRGSTHITKTGSTMGTTAYMSPELVVGSKADERSDIWSFGVVMYELLTGELPFDGLYDQAITYAILEDTPRPIDKIDSEVSTHLVGIVNRCLEKDPNDRYPSFEDIIPDFADSDHEYRQKARAHDEVKKPMVKTGYFSKGFLVLAVIAFLLYPISKYTGLSWFSTPAVAYEEGLAILPFKKIGQSSMTNIDIVSDGLLETLTSKLTQVDNYKGALWVIPASEVIRKNTTTPSDALKEFSVNMAVVGSIQELGDHLKLALNLVDTKSLRQLNSREVISHRDSSAQLQSESGKALLEMLNIELQPDIDRVISLGESDKPIASQYYLNGRGYLLRYEQGENLNYAIRAFQQALKEDPQYALAYAALAESFWHKYQFTDDVDYVEKAKEAIRNAVKIDNELVQVIATQGLINRGTGAYEEAINNFSDVLQMEPGNDMAFRELAGIYVEQGELDKAEENYKLAIQLKPNYWKGYDDLGIFYLAYRGEEDKSIEQFEHILQIEPDSYIGYLHLGNAYLYKDETKLALGYLEKSLEIRQSFAVANNIGALYYREKNYREAIRFYSIAHSLNANSYSILGNLASAHEAVGNNDLARNYYEKAISLAEEQLKVNPQNGEIINDLGVYYADVGQNKQALKYLNLSLELDSNNVQVLFRTAAAYERMGDRETALIMIENALTKGYPLADIINQSELKALVADKRFQQFSEKIAGKTQ